MPRTAIYAAPRPAAGPAAAFRERILLTILYLTVLSSSIAFIEPSPHDGMMCVLAVACLIAGVRFERSDRAAVCAAGVVECRRPDFGYRRGWRRKDHPIRHHLALSGDGGLGICLCAGAKHRGPVRRPALGLYRDRDIRRAVRARRLCAFDPWPRHVHVGRAREVDLQGSERVRPIPDPAGAVPDRTHGHAQDHARRIVRNAVSAGRPAVFLFTRRLDQFRAVGGW